LLAGGAGSADAGDAIRRTLVSKRAAGYNHLIVHESGELYSVEVSAKRFAILYGENGQIVNTNHILDKDMRAIESDSESDRHRACAISVRCAC
jgi:hypothetical protein